MCHPASTESMVLCTDKAESQVTPLGRDSRKNNKGCPHSILPALQLRTAAGHTVHVPVPLCEGARLEGGMQALVERLPDGIRLPQNLPSGLLYRHDSIPDAPQPEHVGQSRVGGAGRLGAVR